MVYKMSARLFSLGIICLALLGLSVFGSRLWDLVITKTTQASDLGTGPIIIHLELDSSVNKSPCKRINGTIRIHNLSGDAISVVSNTDVRSHVTFILCELDG